MPWHKENDLRFSLARNIDQSWIKGFVSVYSWEIIKIVLAINALLPGSINNKNSSLVPTILSKIWSMVSDPFKVTNIDLFVGKSSHIQKGKYILRVLQRRRSSWIHQFFSKVSDFTLFPVQRDEYVNRAWWSSWTLQMVEVVISIYNLSPGSIDPDLRAEAWYRFP